MPRPRTPRKLKIIKGNPGKRKIQDEVEPRIGDVRPPEHLSEAALEEWNRIVPELRLLGILTVVDRAALGGYCACYARWSEAESRLNQHGLVVKSRMGHPVASPFVKIAEVALIQMRQYLNEFGLSPASRSKVGPGNSPDKNQTLAREFFG